MVITIYAGNPIRLKKTWKNDLDSYYQTHKSVILKDEKYRNRIRTPPPVNLLVIKRSFFYDSFMYESGNQI